MLKQRLITAIILIVLFLGAIFNVDTQGLGVLLAVLVAAGAWEWAGLMRLSSALLKSLYLLATVFLLYFSFELLANPSLLENLLIVSALFWLCALLFLCYANATQMNIKAWHISPVISGFIGVLLLLPTWLALLYIHGSLQQGEWFLLFLMVLIWGADSGAYFAGRAWGKNKLAVVVSPGKTWEGFAGAMLIAVVLAIAAAAYWYSDLKPQVMFVLLCLFTVIFSVVGDLFESLFKRQAGVKDSSKLLPGHGGVLDRIDSLTAAAPIFTLGMILLGIQS